MGRRLEGLRQFLSHPFFADLRDFAEGHDTIDPGNRLQRWVAVRLNWQSRCVFASRRCGYELVILCGVFWGWVGCVRCRSNLSRNRAAKEGRAGKAPGRGASRHQRPAIFGSAQAADHTDLPPLWCDHARAPRKAWQERRQQILGLRELPAMQGHRPIP
jgi:hypothetical protein